VLPLLCLNLAKARRPVFCRGNLNYPKNETVCSWGFSLLYISRGALAPGLGGGNRTLARLRLISLHTYC
jgi:hypothetical protein